MEYWTIVGEFDGQITPWTGLFVSRDAAVQAIKTLMQECMGDDFAVTGELEQINASKANPEYEEYVVSFNHETFNLTKHTKVFS